MKRGEKLSEEEKLRRKNLKEENKRLAYEKAYNYTISLNNVDLLEEYVRICDSEYNYYGSGRHIEDTIIAEELERRLKSFGFLPPEAKL